MGGREDAASDHREPTAKHCGRGRGDAGAKGAALGRGIARAGAGQLQPGRGQGSHWGAFGARPDENRTDAGDRALQHAFEPSHSLSELQKAVQGLVAITPDLEQISDSLQAGTVPDFWSFCYPSLKPLGMWMSDLVARCEQMQAWAATAMPRVFWMSGFTYPTGFLTALLQTSARKNGIPIDTLGWDFGVTTNFEDSAVAQPPKEGAFVKGLFLEGARWDVGPGTLTEPLPMELSSNMPFILFKPVENKKKVTKGVYTCPTYLYPIRTGTRERPSFMIACDLKSGQRDGEFWTKRGVAMLLALAT